MKGHVYELDAMVQVVNKILNVERYKHIIYSWNFGIELEDLFGKPMNYVIPELRRRVTEALMQDKRIIAVDNFEFDTSKRRVLVTTFTVTTIYGTIESMKEVKY